VTLWDVEARLKTTLTYDKNKDDISCVEFGRGNASRLLFSAVKNQLYVWDLISLELVWRFSAPANILSLTSCPLTGYLASLAKDHVTILNTWDRAKVATVPDVHATGGAVYGVSEGKSHLYYVTYAGLVKRIGPRQEQSWSQRQVVAAPAKPAVGLVLPKASGRMGAEVAAQLRTGGGGEDVAAMLSVPLHALPPASLMARSFLLSRVTALPRLRAPVVENAEAGAEASAVDQRNAVQRIKRVLQADKKPTQELDLKSFTSLLKTNANVKKISD
jgi:hypothetical protein